MNAIFVAAPSHAAKETSLSGRAIAAGEKSAQLKVIKKGILLLNNDLPEEYSSYWVTAEDLWRRLLHVGVRKSLTLELVYDALRRNNNNQSFLKVWEYNGTRFFRSAIGNTEDNNTIPLGQRLNQTTGRWNRLTLEDALPGHNAK